MKRNVVKAIIAGTAIAVQCVAIGWLVWRYESVVRFGKEVRFRCEAYDPYDPLRGRYLRVRVRATCTNLLERVDGKSWEDTRNAQIFAKLEPATNGLWRVSAVADSLPADGGLWIKSGNATLEHSVSWSEKRTNETNEAFLSRRAKSPFVVRVPMPDQLFVNERLAPMAEEVLDKANSAKGKGAVAVYRVWGSDIVITDIEIDGKSVTALAREIPALR